MNWLDKNSEDTFAINIGAFIVPRSILLAEITEAKYLVKLNKSDTDASAVATRTMANSGISKLAGTTESDAQLVIQFDATDFAASKLEVGKRFYTGLAIKTAAMTNYMEIVLEDDDLYIDNSFFV